MYASGLPVDHQIMGLWNYNVGMGVSPVEDYSLEEVPSGLGDTQEVDQRPSKTKTRL